ncbi:MAG: branched-chain amino acid ABC transporter permease [Proteobacteria bacterium]|nr:branched-chain amino acid ABC transporter permease [Pseudomonadota bacterium]
MSGVASRPTEHPAALALAHRHRLRVWEATPWLIALAVYFAFPTYLAFATEVLITILFAISLDLALGYAGIVTLGHAVFFGVGAYTVGILAKQGLWSEPITGLILAGGAAALIGLASGRVLLRTSGLTLLMLTLCTMALFEEAANMAAELTGGFDGPVNTRLVTCYVISAAIAGIAGGLWAQANAYVNLSTLSLDRAATVLIILVLGGHGRLYGAFVGALAYMTLSHFLSQLYPTAWQLGLGLLLVIIALFARNGICGLGETLLRRINRKAAAS